ncbi:hypothetical protein VPHD292_0058 [Vibrio phage D292]
MKFLLEEKYPRKWLNFNGDVRKVDVIAPTSLGDFIKPRYFKGTTDVPKYSRGPREGEIQVDLLKALAEPVTMKEMMSLLSRSRSGIASGIKALRGKGYIIEIRASHYYLLN